LVKKGKKNGGHIDALRGKRQINESMDKVQAYQKGERPESLQNKQGVGEKKKMTQDAVPNVANWWRKRRHSTRKRIGEKRHEDNCEGSYKS